MLLCGTVAAQRTVEWNDLQPLTDDARRTVYYKKDSKRPLQGKYRIIRGLDEEHVKLSDGMINSDYRRYRDGVLRESGIYVKGKRNGTFTEYYQDGVTPRKETPMLQGKIDGTVKTYFRNGKIEIEKEYKQSVENGRNVALPTRRVSRFLNLIISTGKKMARNGKSSRTAAQYAARLHATTVMENSTVRIVWNQHGRVNPI